MDVGCLILWLIDSYTCIYTLKGGRFPPLGPMQEKPEVSGDDYNREIPSESY